MYPAGLTLESSCSGYVCQGGKGGCVPITYLCNGKEECPEGDDEEYCSPGGCVGEIGMFYIYKDLGVSELFIEVWHY